MEVFPAALMEWGVKAVIGEWRQLRAQGRKNSRKASAASGPFKACDPDEREWRIVSASAMTEGEWQEGRQEEQSTYEAGTHSASRSTVCVPAEPTGEAVFSNKPDRSPIAKRIGAVGSLLVRRAVDLVLPPQCVSCGVLVADHGGLCPSCWHDVRWIERPFCEVLGAPMAVDLGPGALSPLAIAAPPPFDRARAAVMFDRLPRRLVHRLKYSDDTGLARWMAVWMARACTELSARGTIVVPVPLHRSRLLQRRFNQSAELSRHLAGRLRLDHRPDMLVRVKPTRQQVGLGHKERQRNVSGAFAVPDAQRAFLKGRRVLLVDDVLTTGATVSAAARALKRGGASGIDVLTFARVDHGDDGTAFARAAEAFDVVD